MKFLSSFNALLILLPCLLPSLAFAQQDGGGSSTGGGHVRVCLTPSTAEQVKTILISNAQSPLNKQDPFSHLNPIDILSVELLDLLEQPTITPDATKYFDLLPKFMYGSGSATDDSGDPLTYLTAGAEKVALDLEDSGFSAFDRPKSAIVRGLKLMANKSSWVPSAMSIPLTDDFDPKVQNPSNCVFAQVARQTILSSKATRLVYDPRLLAKMSTRDIVALALHEAVYNAVLRAPRFHSFKHPSVTTRQLTILALGLLGADQGSGYFEDVASILEGLGYGPFDDMIRPFHRESALEWAEDVRQMNGELPSKGWAMFYPDDTDPKKRKWQREHKGQKLRQIHFDHCD